MATKSQRRKEKQKKKREQKKKAQQRSWRETLQQQNQPMPAVSNARHRERLAKQIPQAWEGELPEDVAVFDDAVFASLSPELAGQVSAVREALQHASESHGDEALKCISTIPRSSALSEWRLFIRGLVGWLADDTVAANDAWKRLDSQRRPGRIAVAMMNALRSDLEGLSVEKKMAETNGGASVENAAVDWLDRMDDPLLYHAKLLHKVRIDRAALRIAEAGIRIPEEVSALKLGPKKIKWLHEFAAEFRPTEPRLVAALEKVALGRAFAQHYSDLFDSAAKSLMGPPHDRKNRLLTFFYYMGFGNDPSSEKRAERNLEEYLTKDLPQNKELSEPLRHAIASQIHLNEAMMLIKPAGGGPLDFIFGPPEDAKAIRKHLLESVRAYPANRLTYKAYVEWLESKLDNDRLTKPERQPFFDEMTQVMQVWATGLPDDIEPRLWLVDHLLENEQTEEARPHMEWLSASRHDDPRVRAFPWKWQLLEAMRLSRRKGWLSQVPERLKEAESKWPAWLSRQWLPYLHAAWLLRCGKTAEFEERRQQICAESGVARNSLADACMMLGAAQRLNVPAADLKPLREPVDAAVKNISGLPLEELLFASGFFWDLHRTQLLYPAYRMHGGKFAKELLGRLSVQTSMVLNRIDDEQIHTAILWNSAHRFWSDGYELKLPKWYSKPAVERHPLYAAAKVNAYLKLKSRWSREGMEKLSPLLREAAQTQRDSYYRYWFVSLAEKLDENLAKKASSSFGSRFGALDRMFGFGDEDGDDEDGDDLGFDPDCNCAECQAAKRRYEASRKPV